jgi:hypothetical protein
VTEARTFLLATLRLVIGGGDVTNGQLALSCHETAPVIGRCMLINNANYRAIFAINNRCSVR